MISALLAAFVAKDAKEQERRIDHGVLHYLLWSTGRAVPGVGLHTNFLSTGSRGERTDTGHRRELVLEPCIEVGSRFRFTSDQ